jgi:hypothetical protein
MNRTLRENAGALGVPKRAPDTQEWPVEAAAPQSR